MLSSMRKVSTKQLTEKSLSNPEHYDVVSTTFVTVVETMNIVIVI